MNRAADRPPAAPDTAAGLADWLGELDCSDGARAAARMEEALRRTNQSAMVPGQRNGVLRLYALRYMHLRQRVATPGQGGLRSLDAARQHTRQLLRLVGEIAHGARLAVQEATTPDGADTLAALQINAQFLGEAMMLHFCTYQQPPAYMWRELNGLFHYAGSALAGRPEGDDLGRSLLEEACVRTLVTGIAEPLRLPFGQVWQVYELLREWAPRVRQMPLHEPRDSAGLFVVDLDSDGPPLPWARFRNPGSPATRYRLLDCGPLRLPLALQLGRGAGNATGQGCFSPEHLALHLSHAWMLPPRRVSRRPRGRGPLAVSTGFAHCHQQLEAAAAEAPTAYASAAATSERWQLLNEGPDGVVVCTSTEAHTGLSVGALAGVQGLGKAPSAVPGAPSAPVPGVAVVRWLMQRKDHSHMAGLELLTLTPRAVVLHRLDLGGAAPVPAILVPEKGGSRQHCRLLLAPGTAAGGQRYLIRGPGVQRPVEIGALEAPGQGFVSTTATWLV